ncbi:MAG: response regulator transcription factor [Anaerolineae bacterium]|nr:response regulator transcription factor [Anaerolineae bacterium]
MSGDGVRTVIADDHELARAGIRNALADYPAITLVAEVSTGTELFEALREYHPCFLILDVSMPGFVPLKDTLSIRAEYPALRILVVSAYDDDVYVQGLIAAGVDGYHLKDQPLRDLRLAVERVLRGERWISGSLIPKLMSHERNMGPLELSTRQIDIARCLANGLSNKEIADELTLSIKTVENHLTRLYRQINVTSRLEASNHIHAHPELLAQPGRLTAHERVDLRLPAANQASVVVVDDNRRYRKQLCIIIGKLFANVMIYEAESWSELRTILHQIEPRVAFIDVVLGDEDGISCAARTKQMSPSTRVVLISAYPDREFHRRGVESGAAAFIDKKDLDSATIRQMIEDTLSV